MKGIIDIHAHIIPEVDDGARNMEESLALIKLAYLQGVRCIIATPHWNARFNQTKAGMMRTQWSRLALAVKEQYPEMELKTGQEVYFTGSIVERLETKEILTMADSKYVLLEFAPDESYTFIRYAVNHLVVAGYSPILAHAERYTVFSSKPRLLGELIEQGGYIQVNAGSILGHSGCCTKQLCKNLLRHEWVHFVASDMHRLKTREPHLQDCADFIERKFGRDYAEKLFIDHPRKILEDTYI